MRKLSISLLLLLSAIVGVIGVLWAAGPPGVPFSFTAGTSFATGQVSPGVLDVSDYDSDGATDVAVDAGDQWALAREAARACATREASPARIGSQDAARQS